MKKLPKATPRLYAQLCAKESVFCSTQSLSRSTLTTVDSAANWERNAVNERTENSRAQEWIQLLDRGRDRRLTGIRAILRYQGSEASHASSFTLCLRRGTRSSSFFKKRNSCGEWKMV